MIAMDDVPSLNQGLGEVVPDRPESIQHRA